MLRRFCLALLACALVIVFGGQTTQAGWRDTGLAPAYDASSLVISVKKHKHDNGDNNSDNHKHKKNANDEQPDKAMAQESEPESKDAGTTAPNGSTTNQNVLWGDYFYVTPKQ
jgi:hypothetical protein